MRISTLLLLVAALGCGGTPAETETSSPAAPDTETEAPTAPAEPEASALGLPNERRVGETLLTGGQPDEGTLRRARERGVTTVISLRADGESGYEAAAERALVEELGMRFVSVPVAGAEGMTEGNARALDEALAAADGPTVVHCASGNRVGALVALRAFHVEQRSSDQALALGRQAGLTGLEGAVRAHFEAWCETREC